MITHVASTALDVSDRHEALAFNRDVPGFEILTDTDLGGGARWIEVRPKGAQTSIVLSPRRGVPRNPG